MDQAKARILNRLRKRTASKGPLPEALPPVYAPIDEPLEVLFAQQFGANGGRFSYCTSLDELAEQLQVLALQRGWTSIYCAEPLLQNTLAAYELPLSREATDFLTISASLTSCEALVARTGTVFLSSQTNSGRRWSIVPPVHLVIATPNQLVCELRDVLSLQTARLESLPSMLCFASTNSRTADIEKTLVNGAHGPKELFVFLLDN